MKRLLYLLALMPLLGLTSCGEFFEMGGEPDPWDGVTMKVLNDSCCVMVGDSMPLRAEFSPYTPNNSPIYWNTADTTYFKILNDTLVARREGNFKVTAIAGNGRLVDTCRVFVIDRWQIDRLEFSNPYDMVIYADITVDGEEWDDSTMTIAAFLDNDECVGIAEKREWKGIGYTVLRCWTWTEMYAGSITFKCYDRTRFRIFTADQSPEYDALTTLGTLSDLYNIEFNCK